MAVGNMTYWKLAAGAVFMLATVVMHMRTESPKLRPRIILITSSENVESFLSPYQEVIGADYLGYKNHILRVLTYTQHLLPDQATFTKNQKAIEVKTSVHNSIRSRSLPHSCFFTQLALVYHDIGLWTDSELSYLEPSLKQALKKAEELHFTNSEKALVKSIILEHHKLLPFKGPNAEIVEAVRQADLVDFSFGIVNHGIADRHISEAYAALPESNFHLSLVRLLLTLQGHNIPKAVYELSKIFKI